MTQSYVKKIIICPEFGAKVSGVYINNGKLYFVFSVLIIFHTLKIFSYCFNNTFLNNNFFLKFIPKTVDNILLINTKQYYIKTMLKCVK